MARPRGATNNVKAGAFLFLSLIAGFAVVIILAGLKEQLKSRHPYIVRFSVVDGATGLDVGSVVKIAGRPVGRVDKIALRTEPQGELPAGVDCTIKVDKQYRFFGKPVAHLERPLLGSGAEINFAGVGDPAKGEPVAPGSVIRGTNAAPSFLADAGYGEEQKTQLQTILSNAETISADAKGVIADVKQRWPDWGGRLDSITANVDDASKSLKPGVEEVRELIAKARKWVDENQDKLTRVVDNIEAGTNDAKEALARLNHETVDKLHAMLDEGKETAASARNAIDRVDSLITEQTPNLRKSFANARLASDQLKLTLAEVRRSPWRLLYRPDTKEVEFELLYDATRAYADAVSDLRSAGESLDAAATRPPAPGGAGLKQEEIGALSEQVKKAFEEYKAAEEALLRIVLSTDAAKGAEK